MLRKFKVNINSKEYYVEMEEFGAEPSASPAAPVGQPSPAPTASAPVSAPANGETVTAPMPGNILKILVKVGDSVTFEQPLVILEAMKMENELVAPKAGTVTAIHVTEGTSIDVGKPIITVG